MVFRQIYTDMNRFIPLGAALIFFLIIFAGCKMMDALTHKRPTTLEFQPGQPEPKLEQKPAPQPTLPPPAKPSQSYMNGYWDGYHGKWLGPFRWTFDDDYRQGRMQGAYDRENNIKRYPPN